MKTILKIVSSAAIAAVVIGVATEARADSLYFGYRGGYRSRWGIGFGYYPGPVYYAPPPVVYYPSPPPVAYSGPVAQPRTDGPAQPQPVSVADVKALAKGGVADEVILSQIRNSRVVYRLSTAEIIDLKESGVSQKVIDFMINTASQ